MKTTTIKKNKTQKYQKLIDDFDSQLIIASPGRINLIGEHIDYNGGFVLPAAIDKYITLYFKKNNQKHICNIHSIDFDLKFQINLDDILKSETEWENYVLGVLNEINLLRPNHLKGFDCIIKSDLPIGSGISSSAALECGIAKGINLLFNLGLSDLDLINLSREAEHNFVGTRCGIMDQFAVVKGTKDKLIKLNCETLAYELIDAAFGPYQILLLNTNISHNLASSEYNNRREECNTVFSIISKDHSDSKTLVDIPEEVLWEYKNDFQSSLFNRALYVIEENQRVIKAVELLSKNDLKGFGALLYKSHDGLQNLYEVSCDELDFLVEFSRNYDFILGSRMMGGGFGGCTINLIHEDHIIEYIEKVSKAYKERFLIKLTPFTVAISKGVSKK